MIMFPMYNGFRTLEKGPEVHKEGAPTSVVLVAPPAYRTAQIRMDSPTAKRKIPNPNTACSEEAK